MVDFPKTGHVYYIIYLFAYSSEPYAYFVIRVTDTSLCYSKDEPNILMTS